MSNLAVADVHRNPVIYIYIKCVLRVINNLNGGIPYSKHFLWY